MEGDVRWHGSICTEIINFPNRAELHKMQFQPAEMAKNTFKYYQDFTQPM